MVFRISSFNRCLVSICLSVCFILTACLPLANTPPITPTCISSVPDANPYAISPTTNASAIYLNSPNALGTSRQEALFQLGQNMEHWSNHVDIVNDSLHMVRVTVTYLDPVLIQYIVLNYLINDPDFLLNVTTSSPMNMNSFDFEVNNTMANLGARNEMLFIVTITSPFYRRQAINSTDLTVKLPVDQMTLTSASNMQVKPTHSDRILSENMEITHGPVSGIVGFPIALLSQDQQCVLVIDQWTNTLTLDIPSVTLGGIPSQKKFWNIPFRSLVKQTDLYPTPTYDPYILNNPISKFDEPPTPTWKPNSQYDETNKQLYWEEMGRYVWNLVITESHH